MSEHTQETKPLIWTKYGNLPLDSLKYEHQWIDGPEVILFCERWLNDQGEVVKNNTHGYVKTGLVMGMEQAAFPGGPETAPVEGAGPILP